MARYRDEDDDRRDDDFDDRPRRRDRDIDVVAEAKSKVKGPAICLLIVGIISVLMLGWSVVSYFTMLPAQFEAERAKIENNPQMQPAQKQQLKDFMTNYEAIIYKVTPIQWALISISSVLIIVGSLKMMSLSSTGWSYTAAILAMIPLVSGCCLLGIPFGIWALVVLGKPDVKKAFAEKSGSWPRTETDAKTTTTDKSFEIRGSRGTRRLPAMPDRIGSRCGRPRLQGRMPDVQPRFPRQKR